MVFPTQNAQNRDARAINLKLNGLIRATDKARDQMIVAGRQGAFAMLLRLR
ncbi:low affinity iron permease family protein [Granulicella rosea]|uniref:low affinity iron permease family protein n=1 Tax=Granulicella rosea TaxID=474952 RepID=UPI001FEA6801|nr:low affinity iron permease family protein [Granulicella rosea]